MCVEWVNNEYEWYSFMIFLSKLPILWMILPHWSHFIPLSMIPVEEKAGLIQKLYLEMGGQRWRCLSDFVKISLGLFQKVGHHCLKTELLTAQMRSSCRESIFICSIEKGKKPMTGFSHLSWYEGKEETRKWAREGLRRYLNEVRRKESYSFTHK